MAWAAGRRHGVGGGQVTAWAAGLPFAGVPEELAEDVDRILATEPTHPEPDDGGFSHVHDPSASFGLRAFVAPPPASARCAAFGARRRRDRMRRAGRAAPHPGRHRPRRASTATTAACSSAAALAYVATVVLGAFASGGGSASPAGSASS